MFNSSAIKFGVGFIAIILVAVGVWYAVIYFDPDARAEREAMRYLNDLEEQYKNDTYGGKTPEETLELFIAALEKGDIELASKYFLPDKQGEWKKNITVISENGLLQQMSKDISRPKDKQPFIDGEENRFIYYIYNDEGTLALSIDIAKIPNGIWKIVDM